jgi:hypothetical protein
MCHVCVHVCYRVLRGDGQSVVGEVCSYKVRGKSAVRRTVPMHAHDKLRVGRGIYVRICTCNFVYTYKHRLVFDSSREGQVYASAQDQQYMHIT